jgi:hypothetical protein
MVTPLGSEAEAGGYYKRHKRVSHKDLRGDHKKLGEWIEKIEGELGNGSGGGEGNHTLRWDRTLDATTGPDDGCDSERFKCVMNTGTEEAPNYEAVLDLETGMVRERSPDTTKHVWDDTVTDPVNARRHCLRRETGGRMGWRLPSIHALTSLVVPGNPAGDRDLPPGHPFDTDAVSPLYWSATTNADDTTSAWIVNFETGFVGTSGKGFDDLVWCVRGGGPLSIY